MAVCLTWSQLGKCTSNATWPNAYMSTTCRAKCWHTLMHTACKGGGREGGGGGQEPWRTAADAGCHEWQDTN
jgi:hypothetical protein